MKNNTLYKYGYWVLSIFIGLLSALFVVVNARKVRLDADTGNLLSAVKRFDYLYDLFPNFSFSSSIETVVWLLHRAFSFDLIELQLLSSFVIVVFLLVLSISIWKHSDKLSFADSLILVSLVPFVFPSIIGYASWAIVNYPINILFPAFLFYWTFHIAFNSTSAKEKTFYVLFCSLGLLLDLRNFLPLSILFLSIYGIKVREYKSFFYSLNNQDERLKTVFFLLSYIVYFGVFIYLINSQLHKEALAPRDAIQWNYFGYGNNSNVVEYIFGNTLKLFQSAFFSKDIIADEVKVSTANVVLVIGAVSFAMFYSIKSGVIAFKVLSIYCFLCILSVLILGLSGIYAYGNVRYQLWVIYPLYILALVGGGYFLQFVISLALNKVNSKVLIKLLVLLVLIIVLIKQVLVANSEANKELANYRDVVSLLQKNKDYLIADYVVLQKSRVLGLELDSKNSLVIDRKWLKNEEFPDFNLDKMDAAISNVRLFMFVSSWSQNREHVTKVINKIKEGGYFCSVQGSIEQLYIFKCLNEDIPLIPFPSFHYVDNMDEEQKFITLNPGDDILYYRHLPLENGTRLCQPINLDFGRKEQVNLKIQLWRHGKTQSEGASLIVNGTRKNVVSKICHTFEHDHELIRMYIKNQGDSLVKFTLSLNAES